MAGTVPAVVGGIASEVVALPPPRWLPAFGPHGRSSYGRSWWLWPGAAISAEDLYDRGELSSNYGGRGPFGGSKPSLWRDWSGELWMVLNPQAQYPG